MLFANQKMVMDDGGRSEAVDNNQDVVDNDEKGEKVEPGMLLETKDLYRSDPRADWEAWSPDDLGIDSSADSSSAKFALIVRRQKAHADTDETVLALHSITVQSPMIKEILGPVFVGYRGINTNLKKLTFHAPFHEFFYRWDRFVKVMEQAAAAGDDTRRQHFKLLVDIISLEIKPHIEHIEDLLVNKVISFEYLWALFQPGTEVYSRVDDQHRLFSLNEASYLTAHNDRKYLNLSCRYVDTDGARFGYSSRSLKIWEFPAVLPISELDALPSHLKPDVESIRGELEKRGRDFERLKGFQYKAYSGMCTLAEPLWNGSTKLHIDNGRIIVDSAMFRRYNPNLAYSLDPLDQPAPVGHDDPFASMLGIGDDDAVTNSSIFQAPPAFQAVRHAIMNARRQASMAWHKTEKDSSSLGEDHYALCTPWVRGYDLTSKKWVTFLIDDVKDISYNEEAFDRLVLPHDYKRIIRAFVHTQLSSTDGFDDIMRGKGRGIIMLLSGHPGTGKTLTAESVAEVMQKPLYSLSAGELGQSADEVESSLQRVLELSVKWGAVLLLDECDVFLEARSSRDLERNKLVSVFLRLLEYYQGVLFLTTNRVDDMDPAFESRIHLTIHYPDLDFASRLHVWQTFVRPSGQKKQEGYASAIRDADLEQLAKVDMNGRQIKNVVKTARLLATREQKPLALDHVEAVLRVKKGDSAYGDFGQVVVNGE